MNATIRSLFIVLSPMLLSTVSCEQSASISGNYKIDTFEFVPSTPSKVIGEAIPNIWIDTNMELSSLFGGTLTSRLPCSVKIDYTDNSFSFKHLVLTAVKITYDDETKASSPDAVTLPLRITAREYETVNSVAGGKVVKSNAWIISGSIPNVITRVKPFRLQIDGYFTKDDNSTVPIAIDQHFDIKVQNAVKSAQEVLQDK